MRLSECTDEELIRLIRQQEASEAIEVIMNRYKPMVLKMTRVLYLVGGDRDDLIQEGMLGLFKAVRDYDAERSTSFSTFAHLCVSRQVEKAIEKSNRKKHTLLNDSVSLDDEDMAFLLPSVDDSPENILIGEENARSLHTRILELLSPFEQEVLSRFLDGMDYKEIAVVMERSPKSVDNALQRIRTKVKNI